MIPVHVITRIREAVDLPDLAKSYVRLRKAGKRMIGLCPFHIEKSPSFVVYPRHYYCFGCAAKGSCIDFLMRLEGMPFKDAVNYLAARYSIPLEDRPVTRAQQQQARAEADICKWWWEQKLTYIQDAIGLAVELEDYDFAQSMGNILLHMRELTPAQRYAIFTRQITQEERAKYAEHVIYEKVFEKSWLGLAAAKWVQ